LSNREAGKSHTGKIAAARTVYFFFFVVVVVVAVAVAVAVACVGSLTDFVTAKRESSLIVGIDDDMIG